jgi:hypothetical protein
LSNGSTSRIFNGLQDREARPLRRIDWQMEGDVEVKFSVNYEKWGKVGVDVPYPGLLLLILVIHLKRVVPSRNE